MKLLAILLLVGVMGTARADDKASAEQLFRIGASAYKANRFDAAANSFDRAYELFKAPEIAFSAAQAHRLQYQVDRDPMHLKRAIELFEAYVTAVQAGGKRRDALAHLERLRDVSSRLDASGTKVTVVEKQQSSIYVLVALENALITVDGKPADRFTSFDVEPGEHVVAVSADGYFPEQRKVVVANRQVTVPLELRPRPATLTVNAGDANVLIDGRELGTTVMPGKRTLTVYARGREPVVRELDLSPGEERTVDVPLQPTQRRRAVKWVAAGSGALLAGTLVTTIVAISAGSSATDLRDSTTPLTTGQAARYEQLRGRRDRFRTTSFVLGGASLAVAGIAAWLYYADLPEPSELRHTVTPMVFGDGIGVSYGGPL
ncbi:MAG: hypothetical protein ACKV2T_27075 [Kofleriaceae bacterium]